MALSMRARWAVSLQLAKGYLLGTCVKVGRTGRVFSVSRAAVRGFLARLEGEGLVRREGKGCYVFTSAVEGRIAELLGSIGAKWHEYFQRTVPEVHYYVAELPLEWLGYAGRTLVVVDRALRGRISPPRGYRVVYVELRGRKWTYDWDLGYPRAALEQAAADLLSYDPAYPVEQYLLLHMGEVDLDEVARRATQHGLRRLSTFLAYLRVASGRPIAAGFNYLRLADRRILEERLGEYTSLIFANSLDAARGI